MNRVLVVVVVILLIVIGVLSWFLFASPGPSTPAPVVISGTTTPSVPSLPTQPTTPAPLHERISVTSPKANATVGDDFDVKGSAPGPWFFEATFPIKVRDANDNTIGVSHANAIGDWMTDQNVAFQATVHIDDAKYHGPATLILLKDNPSGLPQNDDSLEVPIVIQ